MTFLPAPRLVWIESDRAHSRRTKVQRQMPKVSIGPRDIGLWTFYFGLALVSLAL
jgi:hypothetical protein